ncbi:MAG: ferredoxin reductase family protein [Gaiellaceae bacterium]
MPGHSSIRPEVRALAERALGRPSDWGLRWPSLRLPRPSRSWIGPALIAVSVLATWPAFTGAQGEDGSVAFGLFIGAVSIVLMAWSFVLAVRLRWLEPLFGGLDSMYRSHRWAGALAVVAMFLHTSVESEIEGGVLGASRSLANGAESLAGVGEFLLYALIGLSLIRWFPYRYWRLTHKFLGVPFAFASLHFFTAEKPYANGSGWGWYFGIWMLAGLGAYLTRVVGRDMALQGTRYRVRSVEHQGSTTALSLAPVGAKLKHHAAQFAVLKLQRRGLSEPHVFTIASSPESKELRFYIRSLGDWTEKIRRADLVGADVIVEGPYGEFQPAHPGRAPTYWIAGGVGITPFLSATDGLPTMPGDARPTLVYCVRSREDATARAALEQAALEGRINLEWFESSAGRRFTHESFAALVNGADLRDAHVAVCGPLGLVGSVRDAAFALGAKHVETEAFDIRGGLGPDLSVPIEELVVSSKAAIETRRARVLEESRES